jgi:hypothetical protein
MFVCSGLSSISILLACPPAVCHHGMMTADSPAPCCRLHFAGAIIAQYGSCSHVLAVLLPFSSTKVTITRTGLHKCTTDRAAAVTFCDTAITPKSNTI